MQKIIKILKFQYRVERELERERKRERAQAFDEARGIWMKQISYD